MTSAAITGTYVLHEQTFPCQVGIAVDGGPPQSCLRKEQNPRDVADLGENVEQLRRLQVLTDAALGHLELPQLLEALLARTREMLEVDTCAVLLLDAESQDLVASAAVGIEEEVEQGVRIPFGRGFAGRVAAERRPVILGDVDRADIFNPILREKGIKSLLGVPLIAGDAVVGVLHVGALTPRTFSDEDVELLRLAADRAAIAIDHARAYEAERGARLRLEHVQAVTDAALAHLELDDLLAVLLPRIRQVLGADTCAVLLLDEHRQELVARAAVGIEEEVEQGVRIPFGRGFAGRVAAERRPVILDDVDHADVFNPILREKGIKSLLGVPLIARGEAIGILHIGSLTYRRFTRDDSELLQIVAERVALAIERAQLHQEVVMLDRLKMNFVAIASHELRTPATSVYGVLATIVERGNELSAETRDELLRVGYEQGIRLRHLLEQLLDLSRLDELSITVDTKPIVLRRVLAEIAAEAVPQPADVRIDVEADLAVIADPLVLDRIVSNLLVNAMRYGEPPIVLSADRRDQHTRIAVSDCGAGVPEELRPRLFERFARGEHAHGSGLGLAIARAYARAHGGDLVYEPGTGGARFEVILPNG
jgi:signal transduction histidine kinase